MMIVMKMKQKMQFWSKLLDMIMYAFLFVLSLLTNLPPVPHICVSESGQQWFR